MQHDFDMIDTPPAAPDRPANGHKGTFGSVIVIGGCRTMLGAPALCARAAFRCGAGLVKIAAPQDILPHILTIEPCATGIALCEKTAADLAMFEAADPAHKAVLALGPGLGQSKSAGELVRKLITQPRPMVIDADGLNWLALHKLVDVSCRDAQDNDIPRIVTPHPGEFARLAAHAQIELSAVDLAQRPFAATQLARAAHAIVVLKGQNTIVADGQRVYTNRTGNPALATAGTGDVLTGAIAAFHAQGLSAFDAACLAVHLHGAAADNWACTQGPSGLRAPDLADTLPLALHQHRSS